MARKPRTTPKTRAAEIADRYVTPKGKKRKGRALPPKPEPLLDEEELARPPMAPSAPKPRPLTGRQMKFIAEYLVDLNATQAAIRAGYSERTAGQAGYEALKKPEILAAIEKGKKAQLEAAAFTADSMLQRLKTEVFADLADLYTEAGALKPVHEWPLVWRQGLVAGIEVEELFSGRGEDREHIGTLRKVKLSDRARRLELLGKHIAVNAFRERHEHDIADPLKQLYRELAGQAVRPSEDGEGDAGDAGDEQPMAIRPVEEADDA